MNDSHEPAYYLDLLNPSNCAHIQSAKLNRPFKVLVRSAVDRQDQPILGTALLAEGDAGKTLFIEVDTASGMQKHDRLYSEVLEAIKELNSD